MDSTEKHEHMAAFMIPVVFETAVCVWSLFSVSNLRDFLKKREEIWVFTSALSHIDSKWQL